MLGVIYMLSGVRHAPLLAVSLFTLRTRGRYSGPVALLHGDAAGETACRALAADERAGTCLLRSYKADGGRNGGYADKTLMGSLTPFERSIFLDADTAVMAPGVTDLAPLTDEVVLTRFADWTSLGSKVTARVEKWRAAAATEVDRMMGHPWPAVNTGVLAFGREAEFMRAWREMTLRRARSFIADEIAAQLIYPSHKYRFMEDRYNWSPIYSPRGGSRFEDAIIVHFHGKKHLRKPQGRAIWSPLFAEVWRYNFGGIQGWELQDDVKELTQCLKPG